MRRLRFPGFVEAPGVLGGWAELDWADVTSLGLRCPTSLRVLRIARRRLGYCSQGCKCRYAALLGVETVVGAWLLWRYWVSADFELKPGSWILGLHVGEGLPQRTMTKRLLWGRIALSYRDF